MIDNKYLIQRQGLPLDLKIKRSQRIIREWYEKHNGNVYVAFSGGKDSTVLLHLIRSMYPEVKGVFCDTGLEYPELKQFVKTFDNIEIIRPKMSFIKVIEKYGYPIISKTNSMAISRYRNTTNPIQKEYRKYGTKNGKFIGKSGVIPKKWHYLINAPFKISEQCCEVMKKRPFHNFENNSGLKPFIGLMASDSNSRKIYYLKNGCNAFNLKYPKSFPLGTWKEEDIWNYIKKFNLKYCSIYDTGIKRTGCLFCMFGIMKDDPKNNRFDIMKLTHPKLYDYCMKRLKIKEVLEYLKCSN